MNLKQLHTNGKSVQTKPLFSAQEGRVLSIRLRRGEILQEHVTKLPALLVCVSGAAIYKDENKKSVNLSPGDYITIEKDVKHRVDAIIESDFLLIK